MLKHSTTPVTPTLALLRQDKRPIFYLFIRKNCVCWYRYSKRSVSCDFKKRLLTDRRGSADKRWEWILVCFNSAPSVEDSCEVLSKYFKDLPGLLFTKCLTNASRNTKVSKSIHCILLQCLEINVFSEFLRNLWQCWYWFS